MSSTATSVRQGADARPSALNDRLTAVDGVLLAGFCALGLALRLRVGLDTTYQIHPDETFDYLEQAFRLIAGYGTSSWTYEHGLRSYPFPALIALVMRSAGALGLSAEGQVNAVAAFMAVLSLSVVACAYAWGRRAAGRTGALLAGFLAATWFELLYFAPKTLQEVIGTNVLVIAACLCPDRLPRRWGGPAVGAPAPTSRLLALGGCLGLAIALRVQLAPAAVVIGLWLLWAAPRPALACVLPAALVPVLAFAVCDWITYDYPFQSFVMNIYANTVAGVSAYYGVSPWYELLNIEAHFQGGGAFVCIALLAIAGAFRLPLPMLIAAAIWGTHSLLGHKEYRFIYPAMPFVFTLAGVGSAMLVTLLQRQVPRLIAPALPLVALGCWGFTSLHAATNGQFRREWHRNAGLLEAGRQIARIEGVCGIGAYGIAASALPGYVRFRHNVPVYTISTPARFEEDARSFNVVMAYDDQLPPGGGYTSSACFPNGFGEASQNRRRPHVCVLTRPGPCSPGAISDPDKDRPPSW